MTERRATKYTQIENIARRICAEHGRDWDAKGCKRNHWRKLAIDQANLYLIFGAFGYVRVMS